MNNPNHDPRDYEPINPQNYLERQQELHLQEEQLRLIEEERRIARARRTLVTRRIINGIYFLIGALEILLGLRFLLRLSGANPDNQFAAVIFGISEPFAAPFISLFSNGQRFEVTLLIAMGVYGLLGFLAVMLVNLFRES
ncbi:conserved hypothetical protein [Gloeothece citriformis PCC 7424]|uniref:YggT family protein n=1 Tax=Gloeothece citriformis (strain PCC 7424) TaxID=65393 RepID=B7KJ84_GLOC7|nr:YggT family protein [Gloeothece citriformis]ACK72168.1 conserved hypothetical protein [Gloeothece citriformis PCC 7424]